MQVWIQYRPADLGVAKVLVLLALIFSFLYDGTTAGTCTLILCVIGKSNLKAYEFISTFHVKLQTIVP